MGVANFDEIRALYEKHGWVLRRVLSSGTSGAPVVLPEGVTVMPSDVDSAWFSRPPRPGPVAWEIRYLGEPPFALVQSFDEADPDFENGLKEMETRLREAVAAKA